MSATTVYLVSSDPTNPNAGQNPQELPAIAASGGRPRRQDPEDWTHRNGNMNTDFGVTFDRPLDFYGQRMEVALTQLSFVPMTETIGDPNPDGSPGKLGNNTNDSLWVYLDCLDSENTRVGSQQHQLLCKDLPSKHAHINGESGQTFGHRIQIDVQNPVYVPCMGSRFPSLNIQLRAEDGSQPWSIMPWVPHAGAGPGHVVPYPWPKEEFSFTANGTTAVLSFRPMG